MSRKSLSRTTERSLPISLALDLHALQAQTLRKRASPGLPAPERQFRPTGACPLTAVIPLPIEGGNMPHLSMSKPVAWPTLIFVILLVGVCIAAHFYSWLQPVCDVLKGIGGLGLLVAGAFALKVVTAGGGGGAGTP